VGHGDHRARVFLEMAFEPRHRLGVEMVGRLVEQQQVGRLQQQATQCDTAPLTARKRVDLRVARRAAQRVHRDVELALEFPALDGVDVILQLALFFEQRVHLVVVEFFAKARGHRLEAVQEIADLGESFLDVAEHVLAGIELRLLGKESDLDARGRARFAEEIGVDAREDAQQRTLAGSVGAHHADLRAGQEGQRHPVEDDAIGAHHFADIAQREYELGQGASPSRAGCMVEAAGSLTVR